jgi:hypothetical protein
MTVMHFVRLPRSRPLALAALVIAASLPAAAARGQAPANVPEGSPARYHPLPTLREQAKEQQAWLEMRMERVLPALMEEYGVRMWILSMREYAEDPVFWSITSPTTFAARRRSIYVITRQEDGTLERLALGGTSQGGVFEAFRSTRPAPTQPTGELVGNEQWNLLRELVEDRDPENIVLNIDPVWAFSDGLHAGEAEALVEALGDEYAGRVKNRGERACPDLGGLFELGDHAGGNDHRGRRLVDAPEAARSRIHDVVPDVGGCAAGG